MILRRAIVGVGVVVVSAVSIGSGAFFGVLGAPGARGYTAGKFAFEYGGRSAEVESAEGGHAVPGATTRYEDITVKAGPGLPKALCASLPAVAAARVGEGAIVLADFDGKARSRLEFSSALVTEVGFPACDAGSKDPAFLTLRFSPEIVRAKPGDGKASTATVPAVQKTWLPRNFRLRIDGIADASTSKVTAVDALVLKQKVVDDATGRARAAAGAPSVSNLVFTISEADGAPFQAWYDQVVGKGPAAPRNGSIDYLSPTGDVLLHVDMRGLAVFKLTHDKVEARNEQIRRIKMEATVASAAIGCDTGFWAK